MKVHLLFAALATAGLPSVAFGHFIMEKPLSWQEQSVLGDPQKKGPCGDPGKPTGAVTDFTAGETVHFELVETIPHGGHYRVALGLKGQGDLPPDPPVMAKGGVSISVPIQKPPVFPVLADGELVHEDNIAARKRWMLDVKLPAGMSCDRCVLQITQFMTDHGSNTGGNDGFFYHHCAVINLKVAPPSDAAVVAPPADASVDGAVAKDASPDAGAPADATVAHDTAFASGGTGGVSSTGGAGGSGGTAGEAPAPKPSTSGCAVGGGSPGSLALLLLVVLSACRARRARRWPGTPPRPDGAPAIQPAPPRR
jgi:hypothetical protein